MRARHIRQVVRDADNDGLQDGWEEAAVAEFAAQYDIAFTVPTLQAFPGGFFNPTNESADPDRENADGGRDLGTHKTAGDSLNVFQEYRGFVLDGGGFDGAGQNGHAGGHKRLSPAFKELLVEVDTMPQANAANMPSAANLKTIMEGVAKGFSDGTSGAGIRVYWVVDEASATYQAFAGTTAQVDAAIRNWAINHRNTTQLGEFVHLSFIDANPTRPTNGGFSGTSFGTVIFTGNNAGASNAGNSYLIAHELTHTLLNTINANGFNGVEHMDDPDPMDAPLGALDAIYLMHEYAPNNPPPNFNILFHDLELTQIDLTSKESVER